MLLTRIKVHRMTFADCA